MGRFGAVFRCGAVGGRRQIDDRLFRHHARFRVDRELGDVARLRDPHRFSVRRVERPVGPDLFAWFAGRGVEGVGIAAFFLHDLPRLQVEDREVAREVVPGQRRHVLPVRAERARDDPPVRVLDPVADRRDPLIRRQQQGAVVGLADFLAAERVDAAEVSGGHAHNGHEGHQGSDSAQTPAPEAPASTTSADRNRNRASGGPGNVCRHRLGPERCHARILGAVNPANVA